MATGHDLLTWARTQRGKPYRADAGRFGYDHYDCSGYIWRACQLLGIGIPTVSSTQARWCYDHGLQVPIARAVATPGALLFRGANQGLNGYGPDGHVAFSDGMGGTEEARGRAFGVGHFSSDLRNRRWSGAGLIPGIHYGGAIIDNRKVKPMYDPPLQLSPVSAGRAMRTGHGGWFVGIDGGVYTVGEAPFHGSITDVRPTSRIVDILSTDNDGGYWLLGEDGGIFAQGNAAQPPGVGPVGKPYWGNRRASRFEEGRIGPILFPVVVASTGEKYGPSY